MKTIALRPLILALGYVCLFSLFTSPKARAGVKEIAAIAGKLPSGVSIGTATSAELTQAVIDAIAGPSNLTLNPAIIAGEALKGAGSNAPDLGAQLAQAIIANLNNPAGTFSKINLNAKLFVGTAAVTAATSTAANALQIPGFAAEFIAQNADVSMRNSDAIAIAKYAVKSTTAIGAIIGSRTLNTDLTTDDDRVLLANQAIADKKLTKASQQISQYISEVVTNPADFAFRVTGKDLNKNYLVQIATGTSISNPAQASAIVEALFAGNQTASPVFLATVKNATKLAASLGLIADAENVQAIGVALGSRIGLTDSGTGKIVGIKQTLVNAIAKALVTGLATRATGKTADQLIRNSYSNRIDEIGETGVYLLNSIKNLPVFQGKDAAGNMLTGAKLVAAGKQATAIVTGLIKTIVGASKKVYLPAAAAIDPKKGVQASPIFNAQVAEDIAGGIGLTLNSIGSSGYGPGIYDAIYNALTLDPKIGIKLAGSSKTQFAQIDGTNVGKTIAQLVQNALLAGINNTGDASKIYEDGTNPLLASGPVVNPTFGILTEPETDIRSR